MRRRVALLLLIPLAAMPQQPGRTPRFESTTDLVIVDVNVRDRAGNPIEGLEKEDFTVLEDGKPQTISVFEFQRLEGEPPGRDAGTRRRGDAETRGHGDARYQDRRLLVLFFDFSAMQPPELIRAQEAALKFLEHHMTAADLISILTFSTRLRVVEDFTDDRERLAGTIRGFRSGEISALAAEATTDNSETDPDTGAAFYADQTEFNIFNTDRKLSALESAVRKLGPLPEKKALVYFSSGVGKTGVENQAQLRATVNAAVRANVAFYPVDARGLTALVPGGDATQAASRGAGLFTGQSQRRQRERFNDQQETLVTLAADTGGKALLDTNDLTLGIVQAQRDVRSYYILGYYSANPARDGRFRRIRVTLAGNPQAKLDYRSGYFASKQFAKFTAEDKERQLEEALLLGDPVTELALALEVNYFRLAGDRYFVPVAVKIPGSEIALARKQGNEETAFDFIGQVRDGKGKPVASVRDAIRVKLDEANAAQLGRRHFQYDTGFTLPPGRYQLKFLARENRSGKMGTFETVFEVPDLSREARALRLSSVVWSSQREPLEAAVGSAESRKKLLATHPLVQEGQKLVPSITRVFRKDQKLYVYFEVYDPAGDSAQKAPSVAASLSFFRGRTKAFESTPVQVTQAAGLRVRTLPFQFQIPLAPLGPGPYTCQVNVVDEVCKKFSFPRAQLVLLP